MPQEEAVVYEFNGLKDQAYSLAQEAIASTLDGVDYNASKVLATLLRFTPLLH